MNAQKRFLLVSALLVISLASSTFADVLVLKDGTLVDGDVDSLMRGSSKAIQTLDGRSVGLSDAVATHLGVTAKELKAGIDRSSFTSEGVTIRLNDAFIFERVKKETTERSLQITVEVTNHDERRYLSIKPRGFAIFSNNYEWRVKDDVANDVRTSSTFNDLHGEHKWLRVLDRVEPKKTATGAILFELPLPKTEYLVLDLAPQMFELNERLAFTGGAFLLIPFGNVSTPETRLLAATEAVERYERTADDADRNVAKKLMDVLVSFNEKGVSKLYTRWRKLVPARLPSQMNSIGMEFKLLPKGTAMLGEAGAVQKVTLTKSFELGVHEVTQEQYERVMGTNPSKFKGPLNPVDTVSWHEAIDFCRKLSELPEEKSAGHEYRLPTEAEWEYACRAGTKTKYSFGEDEQLLSEFAWYRSENSKRKTRPVGQKKANAWGLHDMHGNVWEWCQDYWSDSFPRNSVTDPAGLASGHYRVKRGGSWSHSARFCSSASRGRTAADFRDYYLGFRVLRLIRDSPPSTTSTPSRTHGETSFFDIKASGAHFVYVVDYSSSMGFYNQLLVAKSEVASSLQNLDAVQQFHVIFYNTRFREMSLSNRPPSMWWATDIRKNQARQYLSSIGPEGGTAHMPALKKALRYSPENIFLLTDAEKPVMSPDDIDEIRQINRGRTAIHTVEFGRGRGLDVDNFLKKLARENGGTYCYRDVTKFGR
jgi:formylglycine-generating enzyme required for sulfatase activity